MRQCLQTEQWPTKEEVENRLVDTVKQIRQTQASNRVERILHNEQGTQRGPHPGPKKVCQCRPLACRHSSRHFKMFAATRREIAGLIAGYLKFDGIKFDLKVRMTSS